MMWGEQMTTQTKSLYDPDAGRHRRGRAGRDRDAASPQLPGCALANVIGLVVANAGLIGDRRASRQRLVTAQDEARRRLERNLCDGAQQDLS
jgi:hypothetical protein